MTIDRDKFRFKLYVQGEIIEGRDLNGVTATAERIVKRWVPVSTYGLIEWDDKELNFHIRKTMERVLREVEFGEKGELAYLEAKKASRINE